MIKRIFDLIASFFLLIFLFPILLIVIAMVWIRLGRPIFFCQKRTGKNQKTFTIYKFRTMKLDPSQTMSDQERLCPFGLWLRSTSMDELPQLINVIKGELSLVGPRPLPESYLDRYDSEQIRRHDVTPGITGWTQVNGRNQKSWEERFKMDLWYIKNQSFFLDLKILILTVLQVIKRKGIQAPNHWGCQEFLGNSSQSKNNR